LRNYKKRPGPKWAVEPLIVVVVVVVEEEEE
jgi:hypothetical protein